MLGSDRMESSAPLHRDGPDDEVAHGPPFLRVEGLSKQYGGIQALADVTLDVPAGTIQALVGANGAGKSTLVRILAGLERADEGTIYINGHATTITTPQAATGLGLSFIHQELNLVPKFTVLQNMALNFDERRRFGVVNWGRVAERARTVLAQLGEDIPLDREVDRLTVSERWTVSLGRSLMRPARLIAMDEPTASFAAEEAERLFTIVRDLAAQGVAVLYISHRLDEVIDLSDSITVLRNGRLVATLQASTTNRRALTEAIVGRDVAHTVRHELSGESVETILRIEDLVREPRVKGVTLDVRRGEILGVAGLVGAGRTELARLIFGADTPTSGTMTLGGRPFSPKGPHEAIARGVALVPEERRSQGLLLKESLSFNISLATIRRNRWRERLPLLSTAKAREAAQEMMKRFAIKARSVNEGVSALSGGNQQKVVVSKYIRAQPTLLILDEPTVGVDVGARAELYEIIRRRADDGTAVLMISSDFEELEICDRVVVMREGRVVAIVDGAHATKEALTSLCYETEMTEP